MFHNPVNIKNGKFQIFFSIASFAVLTLLLVLFFILPMSARVRGTRARIIENQSKIEAQTKQIAEYQSAEKKLVLIRDSLDEVLGLFPAREEAVALVETLESAVGRAEVAGATLKLTDAQDTEGARRGAAKPAAKVRAAKLKNIDEIPFALTLRGEYRDFMDFLMYLENSPYVIEVRDLAFRAETIQLDDESVRKTGLADGLFNGLFFISQKSP